MGLILAGACLAHKRSAKAKGLAVVPHRAAATPWRPSAPLRHARVGSSTTPPRPLRREEDLRRADQMWPADRLPATFRFLHRDLRCRLFPLGAIFLRTPCAEIWPRQRRAQAHALIEADAIKLALRTRRGERRRGGDERRDDQCRPHEGKPSPNSKRDGSMPTLMLRLLQPLGCCNGTAPLRQAWRGTCYRRRRPTP